MIKRQKQITGNRKREERRGLGVERMRGSHSNPQTPKLPQTQRPGLSRVGVYRLNDSKAEEGLTPQNRKKKQNKVTTGNQEIIGGVKSMLIFTGRRIKNIK